MAIIKVNEKTALNWRRERVGCKRSAPNRHNAPPVKKTKTKKLSSSYQKKQDEMIPDKEPEKEVTADKTSSVSGSAEENWCKDIQYDTNETHLWAEGADSYLLDSCIQYETNGTQLSAKGDDSYLPDSCLQYNTAKRSTKNEEAYNAESMVDKWACSVCKAAAVSIVGFPCYHICPCWDCKFEIDSCPICGVARTNGNGFLAKGGDSHLPDSRLQYNTNGTHFSDEGGDSYFPDLPQYNTNGTHLSAEGGDSNVPDLRSQYNPPEGSTKNEEASEVESQVDRWACRVCKVAAVSIVVLPCSHLCLCWDCESETDSCPICGEAKTDCFYIRSV